MAYEHHKKYVEQKIHYGKDYFFNHVTTVHYVSNACFHCMYGFVND